MKHKYAQKPNFNILARFDLQHTLFINKKANIRLLITKDYKIYKSPPGCKNQKFKCGQFSRTKDHEINNFGFLNLHEIAISTISKRTDYIWGTVVFEN